MVEKIQILLNELRAANRPVWVAALLKMDSLVDRWTFIISAPWITPENRDREFRRLLDLLKRHLNQEELVSIGRFGLLDRDAHLVAGLLTRVSGSDLNNEQINGNFIHSGKVIESNPTVQWQADGLNI